MYKIEKNIDDKRMISYDKIEQASDYDTIIFIDDLIGTGNQFIEFVKKIPIDRLVSKEIKIYYLALIGFEEGIKRIEKETQIKVKVSQKLNEQDLSLSDRCDIFSGTERAKAREILTKYGEKLYKDNGLGFQNFGALIAFEYRTPNITFPIIWSNTKGWYPIFKRYSS